MRHPSENNFNIFASLLLGGMGVSLLLIPRLLNIVTPSQPIWLVMVLGIISFAIALLLQTLTVLNLPTWRARLTQGISSALLILFSILYLNNGFWVEAAILFCAGLMQVVLIFISTSTQFSNFDILNFTFALAGFATGVFLAVAKLDTSLLRWPNYIPYLGIAFFIISFIASTCLIILPKHKKYILRLQAIPWIAWCFIFVPSLYGANLIIPIVLMIAILFLDALPWEQIRVSRDDILVYRVVMIACTIELSVLIFISALLFVLDQAIGSQHNTLVIAHEAAFIFFTLFTAVVYFEGITIIITMNGLMQELNKEESNEYEEDDDGPLSIWNTRFGKYVKPFVLSREGARIKLTAQADQLNVLSQQIANEKKRNAQLTLLMELSQQLENQLDQPVAAQLVVNTLERALSCSLACVFVHEPESQEFMMLAATGEKINLAPPGYRQSATAGLIGRAFRQRKTQIVNDLRRDPDYIQFAGENSLSAVVIPLISNGHVHGMIAFNSEQLNAFSSIDVGLAEAVAAELIRAWERSGYHQRLMNLIQAGSQFSSVVDPNATARDVASVTREILQARFTFVHIQLGQERNFIQSSSSGNASYLLESLEKSLNSEGLLQIIFQAIQPFRIRDVRKYPATSHLTIDNPNLRSMIAIPIRWHQVNIGAIFAFGKQNEVFFTENDESLAELLAIQAAGAFESTWLQQELRSSLRITSLLYRLSNQIIQAENLEEAAVDIAQTAHKLSRSNTTGIVLLNVDESIAAEVKIDSNGLQHGSRHPMKLIKDAMNRGQLIYFSQGKSGIQSCIPIKTPIRNYGAIWMESPDDQTNNPATNPNDMQALVNQAAIALERSMLLAESRRQAIEIKAAYDTLEETYDQTLASLTSALDARDRETEGHSIRVSNLAVKLGEALKFSSDQLKVLERGSLLHDIGKIGISDTILHKPGKLNDEEWKLMKLHPDIGAKIVEGIPFLEDTIPLIRHHQERWNGTGYPSGLKGEDIPILARLFSVIDAFDALTSNRPYRQKISTEEALMYLREQSGILFDPNIVDAFEKLIVEDPQVIAVSD
jgi:HD-GYP domain-containing protein (c-di-GMP phosphodiesterase class II)/putative methionine-R-sulfoxide reductase with GAF domain